MQAQQAREAGRLFSAHPVSARTVMFGDSLIKWGHWQGLLGRDDVLNQGVYGDRTAWALNRVDGVTASRPAEVFTLFGTNDVIARLPVSETLCNYERIVEGLAGATVRILSTPLTNFAEENRMVTAINDGLRSLCVRRGCDFIDLNAVMAPQGHPLYVCDDGRHWTAEGYAVAADAIKQARCAN